MTTIDPKDVTQLKDFELDEDYGELTEPDAPVYWNTDERG